MNQPFQAPTCPSALSAAPAAGVYFPAACGRASAVPNVAGVVRGSGRSLGHREVAS